MHGWSSTAASLRKEESNGQEHDSPRGSPLGPKTVRPLAAVTTF